ncbi:MAG: putative permease [Xanthobacteraceae bacterium]|nr:MAG: putative permease [Xanthobacteraceae bacterium]
MALQVALVLLLIESIFVMEQLISGLLEHLLSTRASLPKAIGLMVTQLPQVFELALPTAILIAVYRVALGLREDREFLMLSSLGIPPHGLIRLVIRIGIAGQLTALLVGGFVDPMSRYTFRLLMFSTSYQSLIGGQATTTRLFETRAGTVVVSPRDDREPTPRLFVRQFNPDGSERVVMANGSRLVGPDADGRVALHLFDFAVDQFVPTTGGAGTAGPTLGYQNSLRGNSTQQSLVFNDIIPFDPRGRSISELMLTELITSAVSDPAHRIEIGKRLGRGLLCVIAPLIALLALSFTTRANQAIVLPVACAALMATEIIGTTVLSSAAATSLPGVLTLLFAGGLALGGCLTIAVALRSSAIARPGLGRT